MVVLGAPFVLKVNEHVRVDVVYSRLTPRRQAMIDLFGIIFFLMPAAILLAWMSWPWFVDSYVNNEMSSNAGGLVRWPVKLLLPLGFGLLMLQGISEIIKRIAYLRGLITMDTHYERPLQ
jgi:TRAP-type mannitol/chloroaromatic compound transport system permease small subunit